MMLTPEVRRILQAKYADYRDQVIAKIRGLPRNSRLSAEDAGLEDIWEEFKHQVQVNESFAFEGYMETVERLCEILLGGLPAHELEFLWLGCEMYLDHDEDDGPPGRDEMIEGVTHELYQQVLDEAANEDLKHDPDKERMIAEHEEDLEPYRAREPEGSSN